MPTPPAKQADHRARARAVYLQVLLASGGRLGSRTAMWKAFWVAHLIHLQDHGRELSRWPILKWKHGPGPRDPFGLEADLEVRGLAQVKEEISAGYKFVTLLIVDEEAARRVVAETLSDEERESVRLATEWQRRMGAAQMSEFSHENSIAWRRADNRAVMEIYIDLLKGDPLGRLTETDKERLREERAHRRAAESYLRELFTP